MATIHEAMLNAAHNLRQDSGFSHKVGIEQLDNAITLLEKGYNINDDADELLEKWGNAVSVPKKGEEE